MNKKHIAGFTLIEALVTIAIAAIVVGFAVPAFQNITKNNNIIAKKNFFSGAVRFARSTAVVEEDNVTFCASDNLIACSGTNTWENGWIILTTDDLGVDTIHKAGEDLSDTLTIRASYFGDNDTLTFDSQGQLLDATGLPGLRGTFTICNDRGPEYAKAVNINTLGRTQKVFRQSGDSIVNDIQGLDVSCP